MNSKKQYKSIQEFYRISNIPESSLKNSKENYTAETLPVVVPVVRQPVNGGTIDPKIWGPPFWFTLHNGAAHYPVNASPLHIERMKNFIIGIPVMLPCSVCQEHATAHIERNFGELEAVCSTRDSLFNFFVDFHNYVNRRYNKPIMSYEDARKLYNI
jgi:hypothetical protein